MSRDKVFGAILVWFLHVIDMDDVGVVSILGFIVSVVYTDIPEVVVNYSAIVSEEGAKRLTTLRWFG